MSVLIDTSIWSTVFRRGRGTVVTEFEHLVRTGTAQLIGPVRQEALQGFRRMRDYEVVRSRLASFVDVPIHREDYEQATLYFNVCRARGVQGSNTDFLLCAVAVSRDVPIFTTDKDFELFARHLPVRLHRMDD
jgi:predicted nucleic acid-binding protein